MELSADWDPPITKTVVHYPSVVSIGDINNDGFNDIVTANYNFDNFSILL